ncbi:MAG: DNA-directed DNA polymerase II small subunit [Candidatus Thorarchaeota archaeon]|nr:DNA-directed DNA polymerase II small subunit [Candidatus Thorarchaeota archaeon]
MPLTPTTRRTVLRKLIGSGLQVSPDALDYILSLDSPLIAVETIIAECASSTYPSVLSLEYIKGQVSEDGSGIHEAVTQEFVSKEASEALEYARINQAETNSWIIELIKSPLEDLVGSQGTVEDFLRLFRDRFRRIRSIYMGRIDTQGAFSPAAAKSFSRDTRRFRAMGREGKRGLKPPSQKVIGIVREKSVSKSGNVIVEIEDEDGVLNAVIPARKEGLKGHELAEKASSILLDEIVCLSGFVDEDGRMIADDVIFPDIPTARHAGRAERDVYATFVSDLHVGSNEFLEDEFDHFIDWLRGHDVDGPDKAMVEKIRYLFIAGDLVDGIGVYPEQFADLVIPSLYDQYSKLAEKLRKLPERIKIICIPGNHDASRQALPKPPIHKEFAKSLYDLGSKVLMVGDPTHIRVEGVDILLTHGDSLDDMVTSIPGASYKDPALPMKALLRKRHLAPIYGGKTELAPLGRDWMVIDSVPDIVHFGHAHHNAKDAYRGVMIINSGTFQSQTEFMRKQGVVPTPGIVTIINLRTGADELKLFYDFSQRAPI